MDRLRSLIAAIAVALWFPGTAALAFDDVAAPYLGTYVGVAEVFDGEGNLLERRDMDIEIRMGDRHDLIVHWINVSLIDGRRDVPGVQRRVQEMRLVEGGPNGTLIEDLRGSIFTGRRNLEVMEGDAVHWARFGEDSLDVYAFGVLPNGMPLLHEYRRVLTETGMNIIFNAYRDGVLIRHIRGTTVRVE